MEIGHRQVTLPVRHVLSEHAKRNNRVLHGRVRLQEHAAVKPVLEDRGDLGLFLGSARLLLDNRGERDELLHGIALVGRGGTNGRVYASVELGEEPPQHNIRRDVVAELIRLRE